MYSLKFILFLTFITEKVNCIENDNDTFIIPFQTSDSSGGEDFGFNIVSGSETTDSSGEEDFAFNIVSGRETTDPREELLMNYNRHIRPIDKEDKKSNTTKVKVNIIIENFGFVNVQDMTYNIEIVLYQRWNDYRLKYTTSEKYLVYTDIRKRLWTPDLFFQNSRTAESKPTEYVWVFQNGDILYSQRMSMTLSCIMRLEEFPMDSQKCYIEMASYGYTVDELEFFWTEGKKSGLRIKLSDRIFLNEFHRPIVGASSCQSVTSTGNFTCLKGELTLVRNFNFYLLYTYLPSALIIILCWFSFFVNFTVIAGRVALCLFSLLSLLTQSTAIIGSLPPVSYVKAIDIWLFFCLAMVLITLAEFSFINSFCKKPISLNVLNEPMDQTDEMNENNEEAGGDFNIEMPDTNCKMEKSTSKTWQMKDLLERFNQNDEQLGHDIDKTFRVIFPVAFVVFNFAYWTYYYANESASLLHTH